MTAEQEAAARTPLQEIQEQETRLAEAMTVFRQRVRNRLEGVDAPRQVTDMLTTLRIPTLYISDDVQAEEEIRAASRWEGDVTDYTEQGLQRQVDVMRQKVTAWFTTLREQLTALRASGLISQQDIADALLAVRAPSEPDARMASAPRITIRFTVVGSANALERSVNGIIGFRDTQAVQTAVRDELQRTLRTLARSNGFELDGDLGIEVAVTRS